MRLKVATTRNIFSMDTGGAIQAKDSFCLVARTLSLSFGQMGSRGVVATGGVGESG